MPVLQNFVSNNIIHLWLDLCKNFIFILGILSNCKIVSEDTDRGVSINFVKIIDSVYTYIYA